MKYIIMCGGNYGAWETPRHLSVIGGEELVARTIRLLKQNGIKDIAISSNNPVFKKFGVPVLEHDNLYNANGFGNVQGDWFNAFYPMEEPACYLFGDVYFSDEAIKTIVTTETDDIELFGSQPPFSKDYIKTHEEPFALKVANQKHLREAIEKTRELDKEHKFWRKPIVWELFTIIKNAPLQVRKDEYTTDYVVINDYTCDVDFKEDILKLELNTGGDRKMIKVEALINFTLSKFNEIKNLVRANKEMDEPGRILKGDTFECDTNLCKYLTGENPKNVVAVRILEVIVDKAVETFEAKVVEAEKVGVTKIEGKVVEAQIAPATEVTAAKKKTTKRTKKNK